MSYHHYSRFDPGIVPLTFLQTLASRRDLIQALRDQPDHAAYWPAPPKNDGVTIRQIQLLARLYLSNSGYGMLADETMRGWMFLRGWHQVLYIAAIVVNREFRRQGIACQLIQFAERQAIELRRKWIAVSLTRENTASMQLFEHAGYKRTNSRIWSLARQTQQFPDADIHLRPIHGAGAWLACRNYSAFDLEAGAVDQFTEPVAFMVDDPLMTRGQQWLLQTGGESIAYLNLHKNQVQPTLYVASKPEWRGKAPLLAAIKQVTQTLSSYNLLFASSLHHAAVQNVLTELEFQENQLPIVKLYKRLEQP